jgi:hypothetical protein
MIGRLILTEALENGPLESNDGKDLAVSDGGFGPKDYSLKRGNLR